MPINRIKILDPVPIRLSLSLQRQLQMWDDSSHAQLEAQEILQPQKPMPTKNKKQTNKSQVLDAILG